MFSDISVRFNLYIVPKWFTLIFNLFVVEIGWMATKQACNKMKLSKMFVRLLSDEGKMSESKCHWHSSVR